MTEPINIIAKLFGDWQTAGAPAEPSEVGAMVVAFLQAADDCGCDPRVARNIRVQFAIMHRYRVAMEEAIKRATLILSEQAQAAADGTHIPAEPSEAYQMGERMGRFSGLGEGRQALQDAINAAWKASNLTREEIE